MSFNIQQILPLIIGSISISGILFKTWQHDKKLEILDSTVEVQRKRINNNYLIINEIHSNISILEFSPYFTSLRMVSYPESSTI